MWQEETINQEILDELLKNVVNPGDSAQDPIDYPSLNHVANPIDIDNEPSESSSSSEEEETMEEENFNEEDAAVYLPVGWEISPSKECQ
jgi:hypothetical protein